LGLVQDDDIVKIKFDRSDRDQGTARTNMLKAAGKYGTTRNPGFASASMQN
jgi:hypothetical protein